MMPPDRDAGYTIMEMLVALVLLCILLIPAAAFVTRLFISTGLQERQLAIQLAEKHMERALLWNDYSAAVREEIAGSFRFRIEQTIRNRAGQMAVIQIAVFRREKQLARFQQSVRLQEIP